MAWVGSQLDTRDSKNNGSFLLSTFSLLLLLYSRTVSFYPSFHVLYHNVSVPNLYKRDYHQKLVSIIIVRFPVDFYTTRKKPTMLLNVRVYRKTPTSWIFTGHHTPFHDLLLFHRMGFTVLVRPPSMTFFEESKLVRLQMKVVDESYKEERFPRFSLTGKRRG